MKLAKDWLKPVLYHPHISVELTNDEQQELLSILDSELAWMDADEKPETYKLVHRVTCKIRRARPEL